MQAIDFKQNRAPHWGRARYIFCLLPKIRAVLKPKTRIKRYPARVSDVAGNFAGNFACEQEINWLSIVSYHTRISQSGAQFCLSVEIDRDHLHSERSI
jgi:hypothetical protein